MVEGDPETLGPGQSSMFEAFANVSSGKERAADSPGALPDSDPGGRLWVCYRPVLQRPG